MGVELGLGVGVGVFRGEVTWPWLVGVIVGASVPSACCCCWTDEGAGMLLRTG